MRNFLILLLISSLAFTSITCKKVTEDVVDCTLQSLTAGMHANLDSENSKLMHFKFYISLSDGYTLDNDIKWDFGNGVTQVADTIVDYVYPESGSYKAVATYTLKKGSGSCSSSTEKDIVIP